MIEGILSTILEIIYTTASNLWQIIQENPLFGVLIAAAIVLVMFILLSTVTNWGGSIMKLAGWGLLIIFIILGIVIFTTQFGAGESISNFLLNITSP